LDIIPRTNMGGERGGGCFLEIKAKKIETCVLILKVI
jgi:hypothetical protein